MKPIVDLGYGAAINADTENQITLIRHLPRLPSPSEKYANVVAYDKRSTCFFRCFKKDENSPWVWEKVTQGYRRVFMIPVPLLDPDSTFSTIVGVLNTTVRYLNDFYGFPFTPVDANEYGSTEEAAVAKFNELVDFVNHVCNTALVHADLLTNSGDTLIDMVPKLNAFVFTVNPSAAAITLVRKMAGINTGTVAQKLTAVLNAAQECQQLAEQFIGV